MVDSKGECSWGWRLPTGGNGVNPTIQRPGAYLSRTVGRDDALRDGTTTDKVGAPEVMARDLVVY
jgi:hypothetical protein